MSSAAPVPSSSVPANSIARLPSTFPYKVGGPTPPALNHPGQVLDSCTRPNSYAISFDDGPGQLTDELLDYLDEQGLKVTFFMNGDNWNCIYRPESQRLLKRAFNAQHQIASHPWSHRDLESLSEREIRQEMYKIEDAFRDILGVVPKYMRPPYGEHSERVRKIMKSMGYVMILWDVDQISNSSSGSSSTGSASAMEDSMLTQT
ncbi:Carbohydrate esterase 4 protein, partial [Linnemannia exigua]